MNHKRINLIIPDPDPKDMPEPGQPVESLFIEPEGATPGRETPGFFILRIGDDWIMSERTSASDKPPLPRQFLSLHAVHEYLLQRFGPAPPLHITKLLTIEPGKPKDFPAIWGGTRGKGRNRLSVQVRYLGSFRYWDQRRVDPMKVGTANEFN